MDLRGGSLAGSCGSVHDVGPVKRFFIGFALGLETAQFGDVLVAAAMQASFLDVPVTKLLFIGHVSLQQDHAGAILLRDVVEGVFELGVAVRVEREFESRDAAQTPMGIRDGLKQLAFGLTDGSEIVLKSREEGGVFFDVIAREQDGLAGERGFHCVFRRSGQTGGGAGSRG
jgi:hypothetical protein